MNHRITDEAKADVRRAAAKYDDDAGCGVDLAKEVLRFITIIGANPQGFSRAPRCPRGRDIRVLKIGRFDYLLYHEVLAAEVVTIAIQHARRASPAWRKRTP